MKCWMLSAAMLLAAAVAIAQEDALLQNDLDIVDAYSLDFSDAEAFAAPLPLEVQWLPPPSTFDNPDPGPGVTCDLDFTVEFEKSECFSCPIPNLASDLFATLAAATEIAKAEAATCACGEKCGCKSGDRSACKCGANCQCGKGTCKCGKNCQCATNGSNGKCACGPGCQCASGACKCGKNCQCATNGSNGKCACGPNCQCAKNAITKVARCGNARKVKVVDDDRAKYFAQIAALRGQGCACGINCRCGEAKVASMKHELDIAYQELRFEQRLAQLRAENQQREFDMLLELAEARAQAAAHQAALEQQSLAHHQQQELVKYIVKLTGGESQPAADGGRLQSRIEHLTIENVQLRHTIEALRGQIERISRRPVPTSNYHQDDVQYFAPGPQFKLSREALEAKASNEGHGLID